MLSPQTVAWLLTSEGGWGWGVCVSRLCQVPFSPVTPWCPGQNPASANAKSTPRSNHSLVHVSDLCSKQVLEHLTVSVGKLLAGMSLGQSMCACDSIIDGATLHSADGTGVSFRLVMGVPSSSLPHQKSTGRALILFVSLMSRNVVMLF